MTTVDKKLIELSASIDEFAENCANDESFALFCLGAKMTDENDADTLQTCLAATGKLDIIHEALFAELSNQILDGEKRLFFMIQDVIEELAREYSNVLQNGELLEDTSNEATDSETSHLSDSSDLSGFDVENLTNVLVFNTSKRKN